MAAQRDCSRLATEVALLRLLSCAKRDRHNATSASASLTLWAWLLSFCRQAEYMPDSRVRSPLLTCVNASWRACRRKIIGIRHTASIPPWACLPHRCCRAQRCTQFAARYLVKVPLSHPPCKCLLALVPRRAHRRSGTDAHSGMLAAQLFLPHRCAKRTAPCWRVSFLFL